MSDLKHSRVTVILTSSVTGFLLLLQALYNEYIHFKETEIPAKEAEKGHIEHLYKLLQVRASGTAEEHEGHRVASRWCITGLRQRDGGFCVSAALCESGHKLRAASRVSWSEDISKVLLLSMLEIVSLNTKHMTGDYKFSFILTQLIAPVC